MSHDVLCSGYLAKEGGRGHSHKNKQTRFFILNDLFLYYYETQPVRPNQQIVFLSESRRWRLFLACPSKFCLCNPVCYSVFFVLFGYLYCFECWSRGFQVYYVAEKASKVDATIGRITTSFVGARRLWLCCADNVTQSCLCALPQQIIHIFPLLGQIASYSSPQFHIYCPAL
jgi:hypothetical protein